MEDNSTQSALQRLSAWFAHEQLENGLVEMTFCPGSDREVGREEAATVAMAMIEYANK